MDFEPIDKNNYDECQNACEEILKTDSKNFVALRGLGCVAQIDGNYEGAISYYNKALENNKNAHQERIIHFEPIDDEELPF